LREPPARSEQPQRLLSAASRLAVEVERLERELAVARKEVAALSARAEIDPLTDIVNRRGFERELKRSLAYVKRYGASAALIYLDLDAFKSINDRHGHAAGDEVLKAAAMVLTRHVRASDLVARIGGDEFGVLLWNLSDADAAEKAAALEAAIERMTATHGARRLSVGASAGVTVLLPLDQAADALARADRAMYLRKRARQGKLSAG
jgi:diguanylate cyclase (GGDEF)-like protein